MAMQGNKRRRLKRRAAKPKICRLCENKVNYVDFKDADMLKKSRLKRSYSSAQNPLDAAQTPEMLCSAIKRARIVSLVF